MRLLNYGTVIIWSRKIQTIEILDLHFLLQQKWFNYVPPVAMVCKSPDAVGCGLGGGGGSVFLTDLTAATGFGFGFSITGTGLGFSTTTGLGFGTGLGRSTLGAGAGRSAFGAGTGLGFGTGFGFSGFAFGGVVVVAVVGSYWGISDLSSDSSDGAVAFTAAVVAAFVSFTAGLAFVTTGLVDSPSSFASRSSTAYN
jgi:hypothetical protein